jgi:hypothetical protein
MSSEQPALSVLDLAPVRAQLPLSLITDFENYTVFTPGDQHAGYLDTLLDQLIAWTKALEPLHASTAASQDQAAA